MSYVDAYVKCDICGKNMKFNDTKKYKIMPRKRFWIRKYEYDDPFCEIFSKELDICTDCWEEMKKCIKERIASNANKE